MLCSIFIVTLIIYEIYGYENDFFVIPNKKYKEIHLGMSDEEIQRKYGNPTYIAYDQKQLDSYIEHYSSYHPHPDRKISHKVFIYDIGPIDIVFIYFGNNNKAEFIHRAKT